MYIRLIVTYCNNKGKLIPKEAHIDNQTDFKTNHEILNNCMNILNKKIDSIKKMIPAHLKNKDFDIIVHGVYLTGYDWVPIVGHQPDGSKQFKWSYGEPVFNIQQLGVPEENRPIIKTS